MVPVTRTGSVDAAVSYEGLLHMSIEVCSRTKIAEYLPEAATAGLIHTPLSMHLSSALVLPCQSALECLRVATNTNRVLADNLIQSTALLLIVLALSLLANCLSSVMAVTCSFAPTTSTLQCG